MAKQFVLDLFRLKVIMNPLLAEEGGGGGGG